MTNRRRTLRPITHEIIKVKQNNIKRTKKTLLEEAKKYRREVGNVCTSAWTDFAIYRQFGRTRGHLKLATWQAFDWSSSHWPPTIPCLKSRIVSVGCSRLMSRICISQNNKKTTEEGNGPTFMANSLILSWNHQTQKWHTFKYYIQNFLFRSKNDINITLQVEIFSKNFQQETIVVLLLLYNFTR